VFIGPGGNRKIINTPSMTVHRRQECGSNFLADQAERVCPGASMRRIHAPCSWNLVVPLSAVQPGLSGSYLSASICLPLYASLYMSLSMGLSLYVSHYGSLWLINASTAGCICFLVEGRAGVGPGKVDERTGGGAG
jgi:hypothetical protein